MNDPTNTGATSREQEPEDRAENLPNSRFIEDTDGSLSTALGKVLEELVQNGIKKHRQSQTDFLTPHRDALCQLKRSGASYAEIAAHLSEKMGFVISGKAVANVVGSGRSNKRRGRRSAAPNTPTSGQDSASATERAQGGPGERSP